MVMAEAGFGKRPEPLKTSCGLELELAVTFDTFYQVKQFL